MDSIVFTNKAQCQDCNRCVRHCPVKAIKIENAQASVVPERCIHCGTCVRECPQHAKHFRNDIFKVKDMLEEGYPIIVSLAPSFAGTFKDNEWFKVPAILRELGFTLITETSMGAYFVAFETRKEYENSGNTRLATACPAVVSFIEKYHPDMIPYLSPVVSPMIAHAKYLREKYGNDFENMKIVFIGPCIAKKAEAERPEFAGLVDAVLTFQELHEWIAEEGMDISSFDDEDFDEPSPDLAKLFPLMGGLIKTANMNPDPHSYSVIDVTGPEEVNAVLDVAKSENDKHIIIEPLFCSQGCINGPAADDGEESVFTRRNRLLRYQKQQSAKSLENPQIADSVSLKTTFAQDPKINRSKYSDEQIAEILAKTGESRLDKRLNCGACGYNSCLDKAIAVLDGMAEIEMCVPYVRHIAEAQRNKLFDTTPNGVLILDYNYNIVSMNPAFKKYFLCSESVVGKPVSYLMDPEPFVRLVAQKEKQISEQIVKHDTYNLVCRQIIYKLEEEKQIIGIFVNITKNIADKTQLEDLKTQTVKQAQELLNHQIDMAEKFAKLLGESAAQGEVLVDNLMRLSDDTSSNDNTNEADTNRLWNSYTQK